MCTKTVIREARLEEIRQEILKSKQLKAYFEKNPREKQILEQDKRRHKLYLHSNSIADVPDYIGILKKLFNLKIVEYFLKTKIV